MFSAPSGHSDIIGWPTSLPFSAIILLTRAQEPIPKFFWELPVMKISVVLIRPFSFILMHRTVTSNTSKPQLQNQVVWYLRSKKEAKSFNITKSFCMFIPAYKKNTCLVLVIWLWAFTRSPNSFEFFLLKRRRNRGKNDFVAGGDLEISIWWGSFSGWFRSGLFLFTRVGILWKRNSLNAIFALKGGTDKTKKKLSNLAKHQCLNDKIPVTLREPL